MTREWEKWDKEGVAEYIHDYWLRDPSGLEDSHREILARLVGSYVPSPEESLLEVGCGTGLVYGKLVPAVINNASYTGVDTSVEMLRIARSIYPEGRFLSGDAFGLKFSDNSFDIVVAFEVLGHIPDIHAPIAEMIRVARKLVVFTVWVSPTDKTQNRDEAIRSEMFLHRIYAHDDVIKAIRGATGGNQLGIEVRTLSGGTWAYVVCKQSPRSDVKFLSFTGMVEAMAQESTKLKNMVSQLCLTHEKNIRRHEVLQRTMAIPVLSKLTSCFDTLITCGAVVTEMVKDDMNARMPREGYRLAISKNLQDMPWVEYALGIGRTGFSGLLLAPVVTIRPTKGTLNVELISSDGKRTQRVSLPARNIEAHAPLRIRFGAASHRTDISYRLRLSSEGIDAPLRFCEWRKYGFFGLGPMQTKPFCSLLFNHCVQRRD